MDGIANAANGSGDLFGDLDFIESWSTTLTYCAVDCPATKRRSSTPSKAAKSL